MAGGTGGKRRAGGRAKTARATAPRTHRPALGNDPFTRGAALRAPAAPATSAPQDELPEVPEPPVAPARAVAAAHARVAEVERRLDAAIDGLEARLGRLASANLAGARQELGETLGKLLPVIRARLASAMDLARLLEPPERLDRFGMDPRLVERAEPLVELLYATWWRTAVRGVEQVPATGPALIVANHAGLVPWDALVLRHALRREHPARRDLRPLLDDRECDLPVLGGLAVRLGGVRASPEAAERILAGGGLLGVFPEGSGGARKPWRDRYRIQRFGRGGFVRVALRARAPIVPCAIVGSEEASPGISRAGWLADRLGIPLLSANPYLRVGPAAILPLPSRWSLRFGAPLDLSRHAPEEADDPAVVNALTEQVRGTLQAMLDEELSARVSVFL
jgi:1-acyl-sn-glycerol-3-phosphate acyltransferase